MLVDSGMIALQSDNGWIIVVMYLVYGVWCMVYGVWCTVYGVWCTVYGVSFLLLHTLREAQKVVCRPS